MFTNCYTNSCGCNSRSSDCGCNDNNNSITNDCGCNNTARNSCSCNTARNGYGCNQNLLGCAFGGATKTLYKVINGLDNTICGGGNGCGC